MATEAINLLREALDMPKQLEYNQTGVGQIIDRNQNIILINDIGHPASHLDYTASYIILYYSCTK